MRCQRTIGRRALDCELRSETWVSAGAGLRTESLYRCGPGVGYPNRTRESSSVVVSRLLMRGLVMRSMPSVVAVVVALGAVTIPAPVRVAGQTPAAQPQATFTRDIAPILQRSCQQCHQPNSLAPMALLTYEQVRPYASAIKRRTS